MNFWKSTQRKPFSGRAGSPVPGLDPRVDSEFKCGAREHRRRASLCCSAAVILIFAPGALAATPPALESPANLALIAEVSTSYVSGHETLQALNDGFNPRHSDDKSHGAYGNWPHQGTEWVQYDWSQPISTGGMEIYWFDDHRGVRVPRACRLYAWDGEAFVEVTGAVGLGLRESQFNVTTFPERTTTRLRLELDGQGESSTGLLEWRVHDSGRSPNFAPVVEAGVDRVVVLAGQTYLRGSIKDDGKPTPNPKVRWRRLSGPGKVTFADVDAPKTTARFSAVGDYVLELKADDGELEHSDRLQVVVAPNPPAKHLDTVWTSPYEISSPFWRARIKSLIVHWIPHCVRKLEDPRTPEGGLENFVQAGKKLAGDPDAKHLGPVFANAWVYNTFESMCLVLLFDAQGDPEILAAQTAIRQTIEAWIPKLLSAQEPDGYLQTQYTIRGQTRWSNRHDHEGYQAGYFIEAALAYTVMTGGEDTRMLEAAQRLADCWVRNIGPAPKRVWYEGHQELEMALVRLAEFMRQRGSAGPERRYVDLAKFLLDSRRGGEEYDQSHLPVIEQYEAVGHAVRAVYSYAGMADVAMKTGDLDYHSAVLSLWDNIVNRKYYVTGGVGSGETAEGFGKDYSLPNHSYCESCASSGELFFQHKLQRAYQDARYADLLEETLYNALLGAVDLEGQNYTYTNPLDASGARYLWHVCPCCVGNIPRTLLRLPAWIYSTGPEAIYVNLFVGSRISLPKIGGTPVELVQTTDYPWSGTVRLTVRPDETRRFTLHVRAPNRQVSQLYASSPTVEGLTRLALNGQPVPVVLVRGYAVLDRTWKAGDTIEWEMPLTVQRVKASPKVAADQGRVALRRGPLIYNLESRDQNLEAVLRPEAALVPIWKPDLLGGVLAIQGVFADGSPLLAIPNYARLNRGGRSVVWIRDE